MSKLNSILDLRLVGDLTLLLRLGDTNFGDTKVGDNTAGVGDSVG